MMVNNEHRVTIEDVAREANVSITTVSRVINNNYPVSRDTRDRVEQAIDKLNFRPNILARSLIVKRTNIIGIVVPSVTNMFFTMVVEGIERTCRDMGYTVLLSHSEGDSNREMECVRNLLSMQVDGIIIADPVTDNMENGQYKDMIKHNPIVFVNGYNQEMDMNYVLNDEREGTEKALEYLIGLGHRSISLIRGAKSYSYDIKEQVYRRIMAEHKLNANDNMIINIGNGNSVETVDNTSDIVFSILKKDNRPTAFFTCNDLMAVGVLNACSRAGMAVPKDISIIGFDNIIISQLSQPKLTTVDQNMFELGRQAAQMVIDIINNGVKTGNRQILKTELLIRNSCSSPE